MLSENSIKDLEKWLKFPNLFKVKLQEAANSGFLFLVLQDPVVDVALKNQLRPILSETLKLLNTKDLMKLYKTMTKKSSVAVNSYMNKVEEYFIRKAPSQRYRVEALRRDFSQRSI